MEIGIKLNNEGHSNELKILNKTPFDVKCLRMMWGPENFNRNSKEINSNLIFAKVLSN